MKRNLLHYQKNLKNIGVIVITPGAISLHFSKKKKKIQNLLLLQISFP